MNVKNKSEAIYYNKKLYNGNFGDRWDLDASPKEYRNKIMKKDLKKILSKLNKKNINFIDIGCGTGALALN
ncbi:hypothetical protein GOV12_02935, partial [Candidatus Pacearchaeota archaeon]|nr:hypothetical protein [Candidatus Pacearchaeota archaeon]